MRSANSLLAEYLTLVSAPPATRCMVTTIGFLFARVGDATMQKVITQTVFGQIRRQRGHMLHELARRKECQILERHAISDHVHISVGLPPKHPMVSLIGFLKAKTPCDCAWLMLITNLLSHPTQFLESAKILLHESKVSVSCKN